jgi:hypothetical protein
LKLVSTLTQIQFHLAMLVFTIDINIVMQYIYLWFLQGYLTLCGPEGLFSAAKQSQTIAVGIVKSVV